MARTCSRCPGEGRRIIISQPAPIASQSGQFYSGFSLTARSTAPHSPYGFHRRAHVGWVRVPSLGTLSFRRSKRLAMISVPDAAPPRKGTWVLSTLAMCCSHSPARCGLLPLPDLANVIRPGLVRARANGEFFRSLRSSKGRLTGQPAQSCPADK